MGRRKKTSRNSDRNDQLLKQILQNKSRAPDATELWSVIEQEFGGPVAFARQAKACYDACEEGTPQKARMMSMLLELRAQAAQEASKDITDGIPLDELEGVIRHMVQQVSE